MSRRETILAALLARVKAATTAEVLMRGREADDFRLAPDELPAVVIEKRRDAAKAENDNSIRTLEIEVAIYTANDDPAADTLNQSIVAAVLAIKSDIPGVRIREGATAWEDTPTEQPILRTSVEFVISYRTDSNSIQ